MQLHHLHRVQPNTKRPPVGRGGKRGKTSGRGGKGQTARAGNKRRPEMRDIIKKLPKRRGYGKNRARSVRGNLPRVRAVNLGALEIAFAANETVSPKALFGKGLVRKVSGRLPPIKLLGTGTLSKALMIEGCEVSASARAAIEKAGGKFL